MTVGDGAGVMMMRAEGSEKVKACAEVSTAFVSGQALSPRFPRNPTSAEVSWVVVELWEED
jgi:hypothetical protein